MANSNAKVSLKTGSDWYSLLVDGEESEPVSYGEVLEMVTKNGRRFLAYAEANGKNIETVTEFWAYEASPVVDVPIVEVDTEDDEDEDDEDEDQGKEGDEDDEDDEDEDEEVEEGVSKSEVV